jgi:hypothetical protein
VPSHPPPPPPPKTTRKSKARAFPLRFASTARPVGAPLFCWAPFEVLRFSRGDPFLEPERALSPVFFFVFFLGYQNKQKQQTNELNFMSNASPSPQSSESTHTFSSSFFATLFEGHAGKKKTSAAACLCGPGPVFGLARLSPVPLSATPAATAADCAKQLGHLSPPPLQTQSRSGKTRGTSRREQRHDRRGKDLKPGNFFLVLSRFAPASGREFERTQKGGARFSFFLFAKLSLGEGRTFFRSFPPRNVLASSFRRRRPRNGAAAARRLGARD